jgi:hypothetical protein
VRALKSAARKSSSLVSGTSQVVEEFGAASYGAPTPLEPRGRYLGAYRFPRPSAEPPRLLRIDDAAGALTISSRRSFRTESASFRLHSFQVDPPVLEYASASIGRRPRHFDGFATLGELPTEFNKQFPALTRSRLPRPIDGKASRHAETDLRHEPDPGRVHRRAR